MQKNTMRGYRRDAIQKKALQSIRVVSDAALMPQKSIVKKSAESIRFIANMARRGYDKDIKRYKKEIKGENSLYMGDIDPVNQHFNFVRFSKYHYYEPEWTQFLVNCLKEKTVGKILWEAICKAVCESIENNERELEGRHKPKKASVIQTGEWENISGSEPNAGKIFAESIEESGRPDIALWADGCYVVIENKISAPLGKDQLIKYYKDASKKSKKIGLVFLTVDDREEECENTGFVNITYKQLGKIIRELLCEMDISGRLNGRLLLLYVPLLVLLNSIEKDLYGFVADRLDNEGDPSKLLELSEYLRKRRSVYGKS